MTDHKDFKRHIRERMEKTGESYTAARQHFVQQPAPPPVAVEEPPAVPDSPVSQPPLASYRRRPKKPQPPVKLDVHAFWRFFDRKDEGARELLRLCQDFVAKFESPGVFLRACSAMMAGPLLSLVTGGYNPSKGERDVLRLFGKQVKWASVPEVPPESEHISLWIKDGLPERFVSQPYELQMDAVREMISYCDKHDLTFTIHGASWHFPGATVLVEFRRKDTFVKFKRPKF